MLLIISLFNFLYSGLNYDKIFLNFSKSINKKTAVAVFCYNRPQYFNQAVKSIERNPESRTLPFFFFLDGGPESRQKDYVKIIDSSAIKEKYIIRRRQNYGIGKNIIDAKRFLFDFCNFETLVLTEEDIQMNDTFFNLLFKVHAWAHEKYDNIGTVQCWNEKCLLSDEQKLDSLNLLKPVLPWWSGVCYTQTKKVWSDIAPILYYYEKNFIDTVKKNTKFKSKPSRGPYAKAINNWLRDLINSRNVSHSSNSLRLDYDRVKDHIISTKNLSGNQDFVNAIALWLKGYERLQTVVNHLIHIGEHGCTFKGDQYKKTSMYLQTLRNYNLSMINDFKIIDNI
jgi:hypothetical protein